MHTAQNYTLGKTKQFCYSGKRSSRALRLTVFKVEKLLDEVRRIH